MVKMGAFDQTLASSPFCFRLTTLLNRLGSGPMPPPQTRPRTWKGSWRHDGNHTFQWKFHLL